MSLYSELLRRRVPQTGAAYVVGALAAWGALDFGADAFSLPESTLRYVIVASLVGLPLALIAAWYLEVRLEQSVVEGAGHTPGVVIGALATGIVGAVVTFGVLFATLGASDHVASPAGVPGFGGRGAIAVLPFQDLSPEGLNQHLGDGIAEEVLVSLQGWGVFPVISRGSTFRYRDQVLDIPTLATELGVRYVLEGSVRVAGANVRVNAQLVDAENDTQIWAETLDADRADVFALQDQIAEQIVTAIAPEITRGEMRRTARARPRDLAAWELVLRAQALILEGTYESQTEARGLLEVALEREPDYALAYARLAEIGHNTSNNLSREFGDAAAVAALLDALVLARKAVQLAPNLVEARIWYGHLLLHDKQVSAGLDELEEAVRLNPSHAQAHAELGFGMALQGRVGESLQQLELAFRLSPNDPRNDRIRTFEALAYLYAGDAEKAARSARLAIDTQPGSPVMLIAALVEISALVRQGELDVARQRVAEFEGFYGELDWPSISRGAWTEDELNRVESDVRAVDMLKG